MKKLQTVPANLFSLILEEFEHTYVSNDPKYLTEEDYHDIAKEVLEGISDFDYTEADYNYVVAKVSEWANF